MPDTPAIMTGATPAVPPIAPTSVPIRRKTARAMLSPRRHYGGVENHALAVDQEQPPPQEAPDHACGARLDV
jgi:hypothetical protein